MLHPYDHHHTGVLDLEWEGIGKAFKSLAEVIAQDFSPQVVVGIAKGGVVPGVFLASAFQVDFFPIKLSSRENEVVVTEHPKWFVRPTADVKGKRALLVDDIAVAGRTLGMAKKALLGKGAATGEKGTRVFTLADFGGPHCQQRKVAGLDKEQVEKMLSEDRVEFDLLVDVLNEHPDETLHGPESPPWVSRDVYAHLARWLDHSNSDMESYCAGCGISPPVDDVEEVNSKWQEEDSCLSLAEARLRAHRAFAKRLSIIASIPLERWDGELERIARYDGSSHLSLHRGYIHLKSSNGPE